jgi:hypothetical protein
MLGGRIGLLTNYLYHVTIITMTTSTERSQILADTTFDIRLTEKSKG